MMLRRAHASPMTEAASALAPVAPTITTASAPSSSSVSRTSVPSDRRSRASADSRPEPLGGTTASKTRKWPPLHRWAASPWTMAAAWASSAMTREFRRSNG
jgi:hypothetical protein